MAGWRAGLGEGEHQVSLCVTRARVCVVQSCLVLLVMCIEHKSQVIVMYVKKYIGKVQLDKDGA